MAESDLGLVRAVDGVSPSITPNAENTDEIYRLDIKTADGMFTTPNLKGTNAQTGGLVFGQDAEGNWGYLPPGADTVVPFKKGGGGGDTSGTIGCVYYDKDISLFKTYIPDLEIVVIGKHEVNTM